MLLRLDRSVAISPFDSITTKRPLADISPPIELTGLSPDVRDELVICATKGSGVKLVVVCAEEKAPATSIHAAVAHRTAISSLTIKTPDE